MTSMVNTVVTAMVAALESGTPVAPNIFRVRLRPLAEDTAQAVVVRPEQAEVAQASDFTGMPLTWTTAISVECYGRSMALTTPDVALDPLIEAVFARVMTDPTLGGLVLSMTPKGIAFDFDSDGEQTACANIVFTVRHRTNGATLS